jgi:hypothetical protein
MENNCELHAVQKTKNYSFCAHIESILKPKEASLIASSLFYNLYDCLWKNWLTAIRQVRPITNEFDIVLNT